jgi:hypothetical protein
MRSLAPGPGRFRSVGRCALLLLVPALAGCGGARAKVWGRVLYDGKPVPGGLVTFVPADPKERAVTAMLDGDGNYEALLPPGEVNIAVDNRELEPRDARPAGLPKDIPAVKDLGGAKPDHSRPKSSPNAGGNRVGRYLKIPDKYYDFEKSGLKYAVEPGNQKHDIELPK